MKDVPTSVSSACLFTTQNHTSTSRSAICTCTNTNFAIVTASFLLIKKWEVETLHPILPHWPYEWFQNKIWASDRLEMERISDLHLTCDIDCAFKIIIAALSNKISAIPSKLFFLTLDTSTNEKYDLVLPELLAHCIANCADLYDDSCGRYIAEALNVQIFSAPRVSFTARFWRMLRVLALHALLLCGYVLQSSASRAFWLLSELFALLRKVFHGFLPAAWLVSYQGSNFFTLMILGREAVSLTLWLLQKHPNKMVPEST